jgi:hypothetical protein
VRHSGQPLHRSGDTWWFITAQRPEIDLDLPQYLEDALPQLSETALDDAAQPLEDLEEHWRNVEDLERTATALQAIKAVYRSYARTELHRVADEAMRESTNGHGSSEPRPRRGHSNRLPPGSSIGPVRPSETCRRSSVASTTTSATSKHGFGQAPSAVLTMPVRPQEHPTKVRPRTIILVVENPRIVEAPAQSRSPTTVVAANGNPSGAVRLLLSQLIASGASLLYHGDFDAAASSTRNASYLHCSKRDEPLPGTTPARAWSHPGPLRSMRHAPAPTTAPTISATPQYSPE